MRFVLCAIVALSLFGSTFAALDSTTGAFWEIDTFITNVRVTGTAAGTIIPKRTITPGFDYILTFQDSIGGTTDSAYTTCIVYGTDGSTIMASEVVKTHLTANARYQVCRLPIGFTAFGKYFKVTFTRYNATNKSNVVRAELIKRSLLNTNIDIQRKR